MHFTCALNRPTQLHFYNKLPRSKRAFGQIFDPLYINLIIGDVTCLTLELGNSFFQIKNLIF